MGGATRIRTLVTIGALLPVGVAIASLTEWGIPNRPLDRNLRRSFQYWQVTDPAEMERMLAWVREDLVAVSEPSALQEALKSAPIPPDATGVRLERPAEMRLSWECVSGALEEDPGESVVYFSHGSWASIPSQSGMLLLSPSNSPVDLFPPGALTDCFDGSEFSRSWSNWAVRFKALGEPEPTTEAGKPFHLEAPIQRARVEPLAGPVQGPYRMTYAASGEWIEVILAMSPKDGIAWSSSMLHGLPLRDENGVAFAYRAFVWSGWELTLGDEPLDQIYKVPRRPDFVTVLISDDVQFPEVVTDEEIHPKPGRDFTAYLKRNQQAVKLTPDQLGLPAALIPGLPFRYTGVETPKPPKPLPWRSILAIAGIISGSFVAGWLASRFRARRTGA